MLPQLGIALLACFPGTASADQRLGAGRFAPRSVGGAKTGHINVREVAKIFGVAADWSSWILQPEKGHGDALAAKVCQANGLCECRSANKELVAVTCAMLSLEALLLEHQGLVRLVEPDSEVSVPPQTEVRVEGWPFKHDPCQSSWGLERIGLPGTDRTGRGVRIYILDSGVRHSHQEFGGRAVPTADFTREDGKQSFHECAQTSEPCCDDDHGHGTHVAGIAIGKSVGVAKDATVHALKVLTLSTGKLSWSVNALNWVRNNGVHPGVVSMSLDADRRSDSLDEATLSVTDAGFTVVVAAGNEAKLAAKISPAGAPTAITVGATGPDSYNTRAAYSNFGTALDIFAPGTHIVSAGRVADTAAMCMSGTSMACPFVSGAAALILERDPLLKWEGVLAELRASAAQGGVHGAQEDDPQYLLSVADLGAHGSPHAPGEEPPGGGDPPPPAGGEEAPEGEEKPPTGQWDMLVGASAAILVLSLCGLAVRQRRRSSGREIELSSPTERPELRDLAELGMDPRSPA